MPDYPRIFTGPTVFDHLIEVTVVLAKLFVVAFVTAAGARRGWDR